MSVSVAADPVLVRFRKALDEMYGDRLDRVVLFGSRARGDAHAESDYDVAVFLHVEICSFGEPAQGCLRNAAML